MGVPTSLGARGTQVILVTVWHQRCPWCPWLSRSQLTFSRAVSVLQSCSLQDNSTELGLFRHAGALKH